MYSLHEGVTFSIHSLNHTESAAVYCVAMMTHTHCALRCCARIRALIRDHVARLDDTRSVLSLVCVSLSSSVSSIRVSLFI